MESKSLRIAGFFNAEYHPRASLSVNDKEIEVRKGEYGTAYFDEVVEFDFKEEYSVDVLKGNYLLFKAKHPSGENILKDCYIQYKMSPEERDAMLDEMLERANEKVMREE